MTYSEFEHKLFIQNNRLSSDVIGCFRLCTYPTQKVYEVPFEDKRMVVTFRNYFNDLSDSVIAVYDKNGYGSEITFDLACEILNKYYKN